MCYILYDLFMHLSHGNGPLSLYFCYVPTKKSRKQQDPWSESASELYRPSDRRLSEKLVPTFADRGQHVVSVTDPYGRILAFQDINC
jgi:hypothetical protein